MIVPLREAPGQRTDRKRQGGEGHGFVTYWLGAGCGGTITQTSSLGDLLCVEEGPRTTAPVPCHYGGSAGPRPMYSYRTSWVRVLPSGATSGMAGRKKAKEIWCVRVYQNVSQAKLNSINIGLFCTEKQLSSMPLDDHTSPLATLPSCHPKRLAAPPGLRGPFL